MGRVAVVNGDGRAVLPPGVLSPVQRYRQPERKRSAWRVVGRILFILVALCVATVLGIAGGAYLYADENANAFSSLSVRTARAAKILNHPIPGQPANALLIGYDHRPEDGTAPSRSDTVMLMRADPQSNSVTLLSFPRDLNVNVRCPDGGSSIRKINSAYAFCGPAGTLETVRALTGLKIHYLITVNFQGFRDIVDKLGGVWIDVDRRYLNLNKQGYDTYATINLWPGYQKLNGKQALDFVRFRHTDSDLFRLARQQQFVKAVKQAVNHKVKNPGTVPKIFKVLRKNVEIGQGGGSISGKTLLNYAFFVYGLPAGNFVQVKIGGLTGTNDLVTDPSNIQAAVDEFQHPDTQAPVKATAQVLHRKLKRSPTPSPKHTSVVVLNGNGVAGSAANTSYLLAQKGYAVKAPPQGFQGKRPRPAGSCVPDAGLLQQGPRRAARGGQDGRPLQLGRRAGLAGGNTGLRTLANGAMLTVVVGKNFNGVLTPTAPDRTPPREPANVTPGKSETLPAVRAAVAWKPGFPLQIPTVIERSSVLDSEVPFRVYKLDKGKTVRFTFRTGSNEYWGIQETDWADAPALEGKNLSEVITAGSTTSITAAPTCTWLSCAQVARPTGS